MPRRVRKMGESADGLTAAGEFRRHDRDLRRMGLLARKLGMKIRDVEILHPGQESDRLLSTREKCSKGRIACRGSYP